MIAAQGDSSDHSNSKTSSAVLKALPTELCWPKGDDGEVLGDRLSPYIPLTRLTLTLIYSPLVHFFFIFFFSCADWRRAGKVEFIM